MKQEQDPQQKAKMTTRDFIRLKKQQIKLQNDNESEMNALYRCIETHDTIKFAAQINSKTPDLVLSFLFQQNSLRGGTLTNLINNPKVQQFFNAINKWSVNNNYFLKHSLTENIQSNQLTKIDFRTKFLNFNRELFKRKSKSIDASENFVPCVNTLSMKSSLFQILYCQYLSLEFVKLILPEHNNFTLIDQLILPLAQELKANNQNFQAFKHLQLYKSNLEQQKVWKTASFKQSLNHPQVLYLKELNFNFMHQLMRKKQYKQIFQLYEILQEKNAGNQQNGKEIADISKVFNLFNNSEETPLDICLRQGTKSQIQKMLIFAEAKQFILLSYSCINKILSNYRLKQEDVESFIDQFLTGNLSSKGYCQPTFHSKRPGILQKITKRFIVSFDSNDVLIAKDTNNSFPLLTYLKKYKEKCKLQYVQKLMPRALQRKIIKQKITGLIKINKGKPICTSPGTELCKQVENLNQYFYPIMLHVASMQKKDDIFEYFINKSYTNFLFFQPGIFNDRNYYHNGGHWIQEYMLYNQDLSENTINKDILSRFLYARQNERNIDDFDMNFQILKSFEKPRYKKMVEKNDWMVTHFIQKLKSYINSFSEQELLNKKIYSFSDKTIHLFSLMPAIFTNQQIVNKFPGLMKNVKNMPPLLNNSDKLIKIMCKIILQQELDEDKIEPQQEKNPYIFQTLKKLYYKQRTLDNLKSRIQFYKANRKQQQEENTFILQFYENQSDLQSKLLFTVKHAINVKIVKDGKYPTVKLFTDKTYGLFFERIRQTQKSLIQVLIRTEDQHLNLFSQVFEQSKQFQSQIIHHLTQNTAGHTKIVNIQKNPSVSRTVNFNIFIKYRQLLNTDFENHRHFFIADIKNRISEIQCIKLRILKGYDGCNCQKQQKQINQLIINGHKIFKDQIVRRLETSLFQCALQAVFIFNKRNNNIIHDSQNQYNERQRLPRQYYKQFLGAICYAQYQRKTNLARAIGQLDLEQMFINPRFDWLVVRISVSGTKKQDLVDVYTKFKLVLNAQKPQKQLKEFLAWKMLATIFNGLSLKDYQQAVRAMKGHSLQTHLYIFNNQTDQSKLVFHICQLTQWEVLPKHRIPLKRGVIYSLASLMIEKEFIINVDNFIRLDEKKHKMNLEAFQKFNQLTKIPDQQKKIKAIMLVKHLIRHQQWKFIADYFKISHFRKSMIAQSLAILADNIQYYQKHLKSSQQVQFVELLKREIKANQLKYDPVMFSDLFVINPEAAFNTYNPKQISLDLLSRCLSKHPQKAKLFNQPQIKLSCMCFQQLYSQAQQQQNSTNIRHATLAKLHSRIKSLFRASIYQFDTKPWLMDLFVLQHRILQRQKQLQQGLKIGSKQKKTLFIQRNILKQYKRFYDETQVSQNIDLLFRNRYIKKLSEIPKELVDAYFLKHQRIKNLPLLQPSLIKDLIQFNKIDQSYTKSVLRTYNFEVIDKFLSHNKIQFSASFIQKLDGQRKGAFLDYICKSQYQSFTIDFLRKYNILEKLSANFQSISSILLNSICCYRKTKVLQYLLQHCQKHKQMNLKFVFNDDCRIFNTGLVMLPSSMAIENNFYQYLMLVKSQGNQVPQFQTSSRFLFDYNIEDFKFIPEMQRRLNILNAFRQSLPKGGSISFYDYIFSSVFGIKNRFQLEPNTLPKHWKNSLKNLFSYVCQGKFHSQDIGIFQKLLFLITEQQKTKITQQILRNIYPKQMRILQSVRKHSIIAPINLSIQCVFENDQTLMPLLLKYSAPVFLQHFSSYLLNKSYKLSLSFMEGFYCNIVFFEINYQEIMMTYLTNNLSNNEGSESQNQQKQGSLYLKKQQLIISILSISKGQGKAFNAVKSSRNWTDLSDSQVIFNLSEQLNKRYGDILTYDAGMWQSVYNAIQAAYQIQPAKKINEKVKNNAKQSFDILSSAIKEIYSISYMSLKTKSSALIDELSEKTNSGSFVYLMALMTAFKVYSDTYQFNEQLKAIKIPPHQQKTIFFVQKQQETGSEIQNGKLVIRCTIQILKYHENLYYICPSFNAITKLIKHKFYLNQVQKHLSVLDNFCAEANRLPLLKNLKFIYGFESFKNIQSFQRIQKLVGFYSQDALHRLLEKIEDLSASNRNQGIYSTSDVYGPINLKEPSNLSIAVQALSFYEYLDLPNRQQPIEVRYLQNERSISQINEIIKKDFIQYVTFFKQQVKDDHKFSHSFSNIIYINDGSKGQKKSSLMIDLHDWSLSNIASIISTVNHYGYALKHKFDNTIDVRLSSQSLIVFVQRLMQREKHQTNIINRMTKFIYGKRHSQMIERILLMIIQDAINIMKVVRGIVIVYKPKQKPQRSNLYQIEQNCSIVSFDYQIHQNLFVITVGLYLHNEMKGELLQAQNCTQLISRKHFLDSIFSSSQFLADYFLNKTLLNQECLKISTQLSKSFNLHVNVSFDYKSIYEFITKMKQTSSIRDIDGYLNGLRSYLLMAMSNSLNLYMVSQEVCTRHQIRIFNTFNSFKTGQKIQDIYKQQQLEFGSRTESKIGLSKVEGSINNLDKPNLIKNMFLIQIFKSQFISVVTEGMVFVLGYKGNKLPKVVKLASRTDINEINVVDLSYLLLVSPRVPTDDQLKSEIVIRIFISDLNGYIYRIDDDITKGLLNQKNQDRNIADIVPMVAPHMVIHFPNQYLSKELMLKDSKQQKVFEVSLSKQRKFKLNPQIPVDISLANQIKTDIVATSSIKKVTEFLRNSFEQNVKLIIKPPKQNPDNVYISQILKLNLSDLQYSLEAFLNMPSMNDDLQIKLSIQQDHNAITNYYLMKRKQLFLMYFKSIRLELQTVESGVIFQKDTIVIRSGNLKSNQIVSGDLITLALVTQIIKNEAKKLPKQVNISEYQRATPASTIKALDSLITAKKQTEQAQLAIKIYRALGYQNHVNFSVLISLQAWQQLKFRQGELILGFKITSSKRQFYNAFDIVSFLINKTVIPPCIQKTQFNPSTRQIQIVNSKAQSLKAVFIRKDGSINCKEIKLQISQGAKLVCTPNQDSLLKYCFVEQENIFWNYAYDIQKKERLVMGKQSSSIIGQQIFVQIISNNQKQIQIDNCPIVLSIKRPFNPQGEFSINITQTHKFDKIEVRAKSRNFCEIYIVFPFSCQATLSYPSLNNLHHSGQSTHLNVISNGELAIQRTKFMELQFRNKVVQPKKEAKNEDNQNLKIFKQPPQQKKMEHIKEQMKESQDKAQKMVYMVNDQSRKFLTRAGQQRIDYIQLCDSDGNPIEGAKVKALFQHVNKLATYQPQHIKKGTLIGLKWKPKVRGHYLTFINGICLNPQYEMGVCANLAEPGLCKIETPKKAAVCFAEQTECTITLRDQFGNTYTQLEESLIGDPLIIQLKLSSMQQFLKAKGSAIDKYGIKKYRFSIDNPKAEDGEIIKVTVGLNLTDMCVFQLQVKGQALKQRKNLLQKDINTIKKSFYKDITVSRARFLEDLFKIAEKSLHTNLSVKFTGEQGIDAGGLKRQFYDMVGRQFKSQRNQFFKATDKRKVEYFLDPQILRNKKKHQYMQLLGKYLANSILNGYLIGVNFSPVFIKLLYEDPVTFDDLLSVIPPEQSERYKFLLKCGDEQFDDLQLYFTAVIDKKKGTEIQLVEDGKNKPVTKQNVRRYLQLLSKTMIVDRFKQVVECFTKGFNSVLDIVVVRRWIRPQQFWSLTAGVKEVTPQIILNYINFQRGNQMVYGWFRRYISQANEEVLTGFLKFASGSGSIDFDQNYKVVVTFQSMGENPKKLPISHTCWKEIIIPRYKTYEIMHKLLNAAFIYCSEGFGFG